MAQQAILKEKLAAYQAKRDFSKTTEPAGDAPAGAVGAPGFSPRFVVQKHAARKLHYDFRLEIDGVFKSWVVAKGPSLDPRDRRLAVQVEDHPLEYGDFEGSIPKGEYGAGTVMLWDRGFWTLEQGDAAEALKKGELKFTLAGEKLQGSWVLVRMEPAGKRDKHADWLLIKHRGGLERDESEPDGDAAPDQETSGQDRSVASGRSMEEIAAGEGRDPQPFITAPGASSVASDFIVPQLCKPVTTPPSGENWLHEIKFDGYRMQLRVAGGRAVMRTRKGLDWTNKFSAIANAAQSLPDVIVDGEVVALDAEGLPDFPALQAALSENRSGDLVYFAFDLLFSEGRDLRRLPLAERKARLRKVLEGAGFTGPRRIRYVDHFTGSGSAVLQSARQMKLEGIVSKRADSPYASGRGGAWTKAKCRLGHEVVVGGWTGGPQDLRSLLVGVYRGDRLVQVGRVGTGFNSRNAPPLLARLKALASDRNPFSAAAPAYGQDSITSDAGVTWVKPRLVVEIEFAGWTETGMVRQGSFKGLREDKDARTVRPERPAPPDEIELPQPEAAPPAGARPSTLPPKSGKAVVAGVVISKPRKELWPADGQNPAVSKLDLARYLEAVGPWMIEHLRGRPCSVVRAPDGVMAETWFQRHVTPGAPSEVELVKVRGDREAYLQIDRVEALIALAQMGVVEFHPWNCKPYNPELPGRLVFDLDPAPDVPFGAVIEAAVELRRRLEKIGLVPFCKTTGGKGLHVVTPLGPDKSKALGWKEAKTFAQTVCSVMAADSPERYLVRMARWLRPGRIYLDFHRNDRTATAVAPLSPRARAGAPVAMPLAWGQVRSGLDPTSFTVHNAPSLMAKSTAWAGYCDAGRPLEAAIRRLVGA